MALVNELLMSIPKLYIFIYAPETLIGNEWLVTLLHSLFYNLW